VQVFALREVKCARGHPKTHGSNIPIFGRLKSNFRGGGGGHLMAQLVEALLYKTEGRGFDFRWCYCNFSLT
jgi:hypothetical protein